MEFWKKGYEVCVLEQVVPWSVHDGGYLKLTTYDDRFEKFYDVYKEKLFDYEYSDEVCNLQQKKQLEKMLQIKEKMKKLLPLAGDEYVWSVLQQMQESWIVDTEFAVLKTILEILQKEKEEGMIKNGFLENITSFEQAYEKYFDIKFCLWREKYWGEANIRDEIRKVSDTARKVVAEHCLL